MWKSFKILYFSFIYLHITIYMKMRQASTLYSYDKSLSICCNMCWWPDRRSPRPSDCYNWWNTLPYPNRISCFYPSNCRGCETHAVSKPLYCFYQRSFIFLLHSLLAFIYHCSFRSLCTYPARLSSFQHLVYFTSTSSNTIYPSRGHHHWYIQLLLLDLM